LIPEREKGLMPLSGVSIEIPGNGIFRKKVFLLILMIFNTEERIQALRNMGLQGGIPSSKMRI